MEAKDFKEQIRKIRMSPEILAEYILVSYNNKYVKLTSLRKIEDIRRDIKMLKNKKHRLNKCCALSYTLNDTEDEETIEDELSAEECISGPIKLVGGSRRRSRFNERDTTISTAA